MRGMGGVHGRLTGCYLMGRIGTGIEISLESSGLDRLLQNEKLIFDEWQTRGKLLYC